jgi:hypothetical protein
VDHNPAAAPEVDETDVTLPRPLPDIIDPLTDPLEDPMIDPMRSPLVPGNAPVVDPSDPANRTPTPDGSISDGSDPATDSILDPPGDHPDTRNTQESDAGPELEQEEQSNGLSDEPIR